MEHPDPAAEALHAELAALESRLTTLQTAEEERRRADQRLRQTHAELEARVRERTAELSESNEQLRIFRTFAEASGLAFGMATLEGQITYWNPALCRLVGEAAPQDAIGRHVSIYYPPGYMERRQNEILPAILAEGFWQGELEVLSRQGKTTPVVQHSFLLRDEVGQPWRVGAALLDITRRKAAEAALHASEAQYRTLVETSPDAVIMADLRGHIRFVSRRVYEMYGAVEPQDFLGKSPLEFIAPDDHPRFLANLRKTIEAGITRNIEYLLRRKDGALFPGEISAAVIRNPAGAPQALVAIVRDVTERHAAHQALLRERQVLEHMLQASDHERQLIAYEIHDGLAQFLAGAIMQLEMAERLRNEDPPRAPPACQAAMELLRQSHFEARRIISGVRPPILDESGVAAAVAHLVYEQRRAKGPQIELHSEVHFARLAPVFENAVYRIVQEGLGNACHHSRSKRVRVELIQRDERLHIAIQDWGQGFDPAQVVGQHYGLEGIRERARLLDGKATIESTPGKGTRIAVELPIITSREEEETTP